ncbi:SPEG neighbor protein-like [Styela clava]|uniref:SPEG neighbor protein-like n=1 Tax=Styela clava TaxID=7725 RepID=UPI001939734E|nr:SPEG neighbor protein-like [Styela clava]
MPASKPPAGVDIDLKDKDVQKAAAMIQKSFRGHRVRKKMLEDGPPRFLDGLQDVTIVEGSASRLDCRLGGFPDPTVTWFKDNQEIKEGSNYQIIFEDPDICALVLLKGRVEDNGRYSCKAFNQFGEVYDHAKVEVSSPAKIEHGPSNISVKAGDTVQLVATISGNPLPEVGWAKGDVDIEEDHRISYEIDDDKTVLTIKKITKKDAGKYECYVENELGTDHTFARIEVKC